jgi:lipoprotein-releasing system permease protein
VRLNISSYIARRYLFSKKSRNIINLISMISMAVVAFVTAAMIIVLSAFSGIEQLVKDLFSTFDAPYTILPEQGRTIPDSVLTASWFEALPDLEYHTPFIEEDAWLNYDRYNVVATVKGVHDDYTRLAPFDSMMYAGSFMLSRDSVAFAVLGLGVRAELGIPVDPGMPAFVSMNAPIRGRRLSRFREDSFCNLSIPVSGSYSANAELDQKYVMVPLAFARELFGMSGEVSGYELSPAPGASEEQFQKELRKRLPEGLTVQTRYDKNALIYKTNASEKWATFLILVFILIIASFNIIASLTMLIIEKRKDIHVLSSMGMTPSAIRNIFILEGILINLTGAVAGTLLGLGFCVAQQQFGLITMIGAVVEYYPVVIKPLDIAGIFLTVTVLGSTFCILLVRTLLRRFAWNETAG